ncbi:AAA family ATPase [Actinokineospora guangxiensis]|uniref:AAA family ATPase n=1 Tax=Actinokineospora guangxiensis TaxID=1490288 RepID=A0ABW0EUZ6_9PSEU
MGQDVLDGEVAAGRPFVLVTGPSGVGRTTALAHAGDRAGRSGRPVAAVSCTARGDVLPVRFTLGDGPLRLPERAGPPFGPVPGAADDADLARRAATAVAARIPAGGVLLIDDAHLLDPDSVAVLHALVLVLGSDGPAGRSCVCTARVLPPRLAAVVADLRGAGLVADVRLAPMSCPEVERELTAALGATPEPALTARVRALGRGLPAARRDAVEALRGAVEVLDRRAYLVRPHAPVEPDPDGALVAAVRALGEDCWSAAKAMAVLAPLGAAAPRLLGAALGVAEDVAGGLLDGLRTAGVLHRGRRGASWRFTVPLVEAALVAALGPFERRRLSALAVTAVWSGEASCQDPHRVADRIADAGFLLDRDRAVRALLEHAATAPGERSLRWLTAAAALAGDDAERADIRFRHVVACAAGADRARTLSAARLLLDEHAGHLTADAVQEVRAITADAVDDHAALTDLATTGDPVTRARALLRLNRFRDVRALLLADESWRTDNAVSAMLGERTLALAELWTGSPDRFAALTAPAPGRHLLAHVTTRVEALLTLGEAEEAHRTAAEADLAETALPEHVRALLAAARGDAATAIDLTRRAVALGTRHPAAIAAAAALLTARGELPAARQLIASGRDVPAALPHLLDIAEARLDRAHGDDDAARARLLRRAEDDLAAGMDLLHSELIDLAVARGDRPEAERSLAALQALPRTSRADLLTHLARATVDKDHEAALACERAARRSADPLERATTFTRLVEHAPHLLPEAYAALSGLDALLHRAWTRNLMRDHAIPVPGRQECVAENEHLLAVLAAGGLTNKQLAAALRTSDKSVEGRLSRLFTRTGYRSRIELSTAILKGDYRPGS